MRFLDRVFRRKEKTEFVFRMPPPMPTLPYPPRLMFSDRVLEIKKQQRELLVACLTGGMTYEQAKDAVEKETANEMAKAENADEQARKVNDDLSRVHQNRVDEYSSEMQRWLSNRQAGNSMLDNPTT